jgi:hypothetical protein
MGLDVKLIVPLTNRKKLCFLGGSVNKAIYLDYNATTPHDPEDPEVIDAMTPFLTNHFGNFNSTFLT